MDSKELTKCIVKGVVIAELIMAAIAAVSYFIIGKISSGSFNVGILIVAVILIAIFVYVFSALNSSNKEQR